MIYDIYCDPGQWQCAFTLSQGSNYLGSTLILDETENLNLRASGLRTKLFAWIATKALPEETLIHLHTFNFNGEKMQVYPTSPNPNCLIDVSLTTGALISSYPWGSIKLFTGKSWKSNIPKKKMTEIIKKRRDAVPDHLETMKRTAGGVYNNHNVLDSFGMYIHYQGKLL